MKKGKFMQTLHQQRSAQTTHNKTKFKKRGLFIVVEGIDASGKTTQFHLLKKRMQSEKIKLLIADFPRYEKSAWGALVGRFLEGEFGELEGVNPYLAVIPYMMDQYTWSRDVAVPWVDKGGWILTNRYFTSNVHQIAKLKTRSQKRFRDWLWSLGYDVQGLLKPDLVVFIDTTPEVARSLIYSKEERKYLNGKKRDIAEKNWNHQVAAYKEYKRTVLANDWWVSVPGVKSADKDYSEQIHEKVWEIVKKKYFKF